MALLMFALLILVLFIAYFVGKEDLLSPWFLLCLAFFASFGIVLLNKNNWEVQINGLFVLYVFTALLAFGCGAQLINLSANSKKKKSESISVNVKEIVSVKYPTKLLACISVIMCVGYILKLIIDFRGSASSFSALIRNIYSNIVENDYSPGFLFNQMREIVGAIAYVSMFRLIIQIYFPKNKVSKIALIIPIFLFIVLALISSDRNIFLRFAIFSICIWVIIFREKLKHRNSGSANLKIIFNGIIILIVVILIFYLFGKIKLYTSNLNRMVGIYGGSGLYNFNFWLESFEGPLTMGETTFSVLLSTIKTVLNPIGINFEVSGLEVDFITYRSANGYVYSSNIYSSLINYVIDFGYFGVILFPFIIGMFFQWLFNRARRKGGFNILLYCLLIYAVIYFPIVEQLFGRLHLGMLYEIGWLAIVYLSIFGKRKKLAKKQFASKTLRVKENET